jgi:hypothetical protein
VMDDGGGVGNNSKSAVQVDVNGQIAGKQG